ncbi:UNVERIFIED_CONTAM: ABC transporter F family member 5 [Sesamum calycinum]|uniref:ABC transporter F family member 5 n=1 Tax=Sesamum calycinum TaxID=2727403 RepID=A0AAW2SU61_9LAMI
MELALKAQFMELRSSFLAGATPVCHSFAAGRRPLYRSLTSTTTIATSSSLKTTVVHPTSLKHPTRIWSKLHAVATETSTTTLEEEDEDIESFSLIMVLAHQKLTISGNINWEVKKGEKVGLVGVNGAGKTTQTVKEEFLSAFKEEMEVAARLEKVQKAIEKSVDDLELMGRLLDEFDLLQRRAQAVDLDEVDVKISKLMPELGFAPEDGDRLVASFSGGWQMRMSLGKILLQDPDLLLLDEPTNHLDLDTIEWLEGYLNKQDVPMVIISHDRAFLDQLCTKIVETDMGVSRTHEGNYSEYVIAKAAWIEAQLAAWEKQQKEIEQTRDLISRLSAGANAGRASTAEKVYIDTLICYFIIIMKV